MKEDIKQQARLLRKNGFSFREISEQLSLSKSTVSLWCRFEKVTENGARRLKKLEEDGRKKSIITNSLKRQNILSDIRKDVYLSYDKFYSVSDYKLLLAMLYWGEGEKSGARLNFTNSDPKLIEVYLRLLRLSFDIKEERFFCILHLHSYHNKEKMLDFWSGITGIAKRQISIYNKENSGKQKKTDYKGCISVRYHNYLFFNEIMIIIERFSVLFH